MSKDERVFKPDYEEMRADFVDSRQQSIPAQWDRFRWAIERQLDVLGDGPYTIERGVSDMFRSAVFCYIAGSPQGCIVLASAAMERRLRILTRSEEDVQFAAVTCLAEELELISKELAEALHDFRKTIRVPVTHAKTEYLIGALKMKKTRQGNQTMWEAPRNQTAITTMEAAVRSIELFLRLVKETER